MARTDTQLAIIRNWLMDGKSITPIEALDLCGCFRLSAIIHTLRHKECMTIHSDKPEIHDGKPYSRYWWDKTELEMMRKADA